MKLKKIVVIFLCIIFIYNYSGVYAFSTLLNTSENDETTIQENQLDENEIQQENNDINNEISDETNEVDDKSNITEENQKTNETNETEPDNNEIDDKNNETEKNQNTNESDNESNETEPDNNEIDDENNETEENQNTNEIDDESNETEPDNNDIDDNNIDNNIKEDEEIITDEIKSKSMDYNSISLSTSDYLKDGVYFISSAINNKKVLDISAGSNNNFANVQLWTNTNVSQQKFKISKLSDGYYIIQNCKSGKCIDVDNAKSISGTNVWQYEKNNSSAQKWLIKDCGDGYYNIISNCGGLYLDAVTNKIKDGTNIVINAKNESDSQKFKFIPVEEYWGTQSIADGTYTISTALNNKQVLDVSQGSTSDMANIQLWTNTNVEQQRFMITYVGEGYYTIRSYHSGKALDVANAKSENGTNVWQYGANNSSAQKWVIKDSGDGYYYIISRCGGLYLDVANAKTSNGTNIQIYSGNQSKAQKFKFTKLENYTNIQSIENGVYNISTKLNNNRVLDVSAGSTSNCANIQLWDNTNVMQQKFEITYLDNGFYQIKCIKSGKVLDIANGSFKSGTNVWQYEANYSAAQSWIIKDAGDGYYYIISKNGNLCLDVSNAQTACGTNIQVYEKNESNAQKFKLTRVITRGIDVSVYQGDINWSEVRKDKIDFALLRVGYRGYGTGGIAKDERYDEYVKNATKNGIYCGVYFFSQAVNYDEGVEEAKWVLKTISKDDITCPIAIDVEWAGGSEGHNGRADYISVEARTEAVRGFCETIENAGYEAMIYANKTWLQKYIDMSRLSKYKVWLAHYVTGAPERKSDYKGNYTYWQYTSSGSVRRNRRKRGFRLYIIKRWIKVEK